MPKRHKMSLATAAKTRLPPNVVANSDLSAVAQRTAASAVARRAKAEATKPSGRHEVRARNRATLLAGNDIEHPMRMPNHRSTINRRLGNFLSSGCSLCAVLAKPWKQGAGKSAAEHRPASPELRPALAIAFET